MARGKGDNDDTLGTRIPVGGEWNQHGLWISHITSFGVAASGWPGGVSFGGARPPAPAR